MNDLTLPADFNRLQETTADAPANVTLAAPATDDVAAARTKRILSSLRVRDQDGVALPLVIAVKSLSRPGRGLVVSGTARTAVSPARDANLTATFDEAGRLDTLVVAPEADDDDAQVKLGPLSGLRVRIEWLCYRPSPDRPQLTSQIQGRITVKGQGVPVRIVTAPDGLWVIDAMRSVELARRLFDDTADDRGLSGFTAEELLALGAPTGGASDDLVESQLREFLALTGRSAGLTVDRLQVGFLPGDGEIEHLRCELGFASKLDPWVIIKDKVEVEGVEIDLRLKHPDDPRRRHLEGSLAGQIKVGGDARIGFRLAREGERWLLSPRDPAVKLDLRALLDWIGATSLAEGVPSWAGADSAMQLEGMALGVAENESGLARVSLLRGTVAWTRQIAFPGLEDRAQITKLWAGLEVSFPFDAQRREAVFSLGGQGSVRVASSRVLDCELSGWIRGGAGESRWSIQAAVKGSLSLTDALDSLVGVALGDRSTSLFGDFDLSVADPTLTVASKGTFGLDTDVLIQKKSGAASNSFNIGVGKLEFQPAHIAVWRNADGARYSLRAGLSIEFDVGPKVEECALWVSHETASGKGVTDVSLSVTVAFPRAAPNPPITLVLLGRYESNKGVSFRGSVSAVPLNPVIDEMLRPLGQRLPDPSKGFPELTASDLRLTLDTGTGEYSASGKASASPFTIDTVTICDARFEFKVASTAKKLDANGPKPSGTGVSLFGGAKVLRKGRAKVSPLTAASYQSSDYAPGDFIEVALRIEFDGSSSDYTATINGLLLSDFVSAFETGVAAPSPADDFKIAALGFRYRSQKPPSPAQGEAPVPATAMSFFMDWKRDGADLGRFDLSLAKRDESDRPHALIVARPKLSWLSNAEIGWASESFREVPLGLATVPPLSQPLTASAYSFRRGLFLKGTLNTRGTFVERRLGLVDPIRVEIDDCLVVDLGAKGRLFFDVTGKTDANRPDAKSPAALPPGDAGAGGPSDPAKALPAPADEEGSKTVRFDMTLSPALILNKLAPANDGASSGNVWREHLGKCLVLSNLGVTLHSKPKPAVTAFADVGVNVGPWVSVAVKSAAVKLTPASLSAEGLKSLSAEFDVQGAAISINAQPWFRGSVAVLRDREDTVGLTVVGLGEVQLLKKVRIGALAFLRWVRADGGHSLDAGFGFVFATGFAVPLPPSPLVLTGLAGGFGYGAVPKLPSRAEDVADNALLKLMRGGEPDFTAKGMLDRLDGFKRSVEVQPGAWCVMFGLTLTLARVVECALLAVVESRREGMEVSLLGIADIPLGTRPGSGGTAFGHIQLAILARWSQAAGAVTVLGAITGESWIFDEKCRLQGGFALCVWYGGPHAGDFLVSLGGYSPFAPRRPHYPALDRVGLRWRVNDALSIYGEAYLTLDRYSLQLGAAAGMSYRTSKVKLEAHFSFDAIVEWAPLYYEAQLRISVHVEIKVAITLRLGLDVDVHLWGPPFGAELHIEVDLWPFNPSFDVAIGSNYEEAQFERNNVSFNRVVELAAGAKDASTLKFTSGDSPAVLVADGAKVTSSSRSHRFAAERPCAADSATVSLETAIPATEVSYEGAGGARFTAGDRGLQVRPKRWQQVRSSLVLSVFELIARKGAEAARRAAPTPWTLAPVMSQPLESLWALPQNRERPWDVVRGELITAVVLSPPADNSGARFDGVTLTKETRQHERYVRIGDTTIPTPTTAPRAAVDEAIAKDHAGLGRALAELGFAAGRRARSGFRALEATPMKVNGLDWRGGW